MSGKNLRIFLFCGWILAAIMVIAGTICAAFGQPVGYAMMLVGAGILIAVTIELVPLLDKRSGDGSEGDGSEKDKK